MPLLVAHQILIASAIALAALFGTRAAFLYGREHQTADLVIALVSLVTGLVLTRYFRSVRLKWLATRKKPGDQRR